VAQPRARARRPRPEPSDAELVEAAVAGQREAFGELYVRHARLVNAIVLVRAPAGEARDLVHEVFAAALRQLPTLRDPSAFAPWIAAIARKLAALQRRSARTILPMEDQPVEAPPPEAFAVLDALRRLPEAYRETVALRLVAGMTGPEIAARTGMTPGSVRVNLCRGLKILRASMGGDDDA
jgi:RNA polymerase sigma-70 factor (ECF subfamily)